MLQADHKMDAAFACLTAALPVPNSLLKSKKEAIEKQIYFIYKIKVTIYVCGILCLNSIFQLIVVITGNLIFTMLFVVPLLKYLQ